MKKSYIFLLLSIFIIIVLFFISPIILIYTVDYSYDPASILVDSEQATLVRITSVFEKTNDPLKRFQQMMFVWLETGCSYHPVTWSDDSNYLVFHQKDGKTRPKICGEVPTYTYDLVEDKLKDWNYLELEFNPTAPFYWEDPDSQRILQQYISLDNINKSEQQKLYLKRVLISPDNMKIAFTIGRGGSIMSPDDLFILEIINK